VNIPTRKLNVSIFQKSKGTKIFCDAAEVGDVQHMHEVLAGGIPSLGVDRTRDHALESRCRYVCRCCGEVKSRVAKAIGTPHKTRKHISAKALVE
jgi:hypothetical protein